MSTEDKETIVEQNNEVQEPTPSASPVSETTQSVESKPPVNDDINKQILETLKLLNENNIRLKAELEGQKEIVQQMRDEIDSNKRINVTVDEFLAVYDYSKDAKTIINNDYQTEEKNAREMYDSLKMKYNVI